MVFKIPTCCLGCLLDGHHPRDERPPDRLDDDIRVEGLTNQADITLKDTCHLRITRAVAGQHAN
jgi:hypothetical protein